MKYFMLCSIAFWVFQSYGQFDCDKLPNGKYLAHFTQGAYKDYRISIQDGTFVQNSKKHHSAYGKIKWIDKCVFSMEFSTKNGIDSVAGPLKLIHDSWGPPCIELKDVKKDTIEFRTTYPGNFHITVNEGYFLKL